MDSEELEPSKRWCINIDIEGFSKKYQVEKGRDINDKERLKSRGDVIFSFRCLTEAVYNIGTNVYGKTGIVGKDDSANRLFAHQIGDGFQIVSDFNNDIDRAIAISIALMRHVLESGGIAKAGIGLGDFQDISCYYPPKITENLCDGRVALGSGIMKISPVMGTAWISAIETANKASGSLLLISSECKSFVSPEFEVNKIEGDAYSVNWLKGESDLVTKIMREAGFDIPTEQKRIDKFHEYLNNSEQKGLRKEWVKNTCCYQDVILTNECKKYEVKI